MDESAWGPSPITGTTEPPPRRHDTPPPQARRVIARIAWSDGTESERHTLATNWTSTHVLVYVGGGWAHPRNGEMRWIPAGRVRRDDTAVQPGTTIPYPPGGPSSVLKISEQCGAGHPVTFPAWALAADNIDRVDVSARSYRWRCSTCGGGLTGPPHRENHQPVAAPSGPGASVG